MQLRDRRGFYESLLSEPNVQRALNTIKAAEGTTRYANPYAAGFGGRTLQSLDKHPNTSASFRDKSGQRGKTTAAGAYQFLGGTWNEMKNALGLKDFSQKNQDIAAIGLLDRAGALGHVMTGNVKGFVDSAKGTWASFPGSPYNQPTKSMDFVQSAWNSPITSFEPDIRSVPTPTARPDMAFSAPRTSVERAPLSKEVPMASFDMGRFGPTAPTTTAFDAGRFGPTPTTSTAFDMQRFGPVEDAAAGMAGLKQGLLAQQTAMGVTPYADPAVSRQVAQPSVHVSQPVDMTRTGATGMPSMATPTISQAQRDIAAKTQKDMQARSLLSTVGGAVLGGALLGPIGGLLGGYAGKSFANSNYFPDAPEKLNPGGRDDRGYGGLNDYGRSAYNESKDFRDAVDKGSSGLW